MEQQNNMEWKVEIEEQNNMEFGELQHRTYEGTNEGRGSYL
jgi:hypothetical protein